MKRIVISIDAMGGAYAPNAVIDAISQSCFSNPHIHFLIFGLEESVLPLLKNSSINPNRYEFIATHSLVLDQDKPIHALKNGKSSSMRKALDAVKDGIASACVSAGNTGALMVMSKIVLGVLPGVKRPAISGVFPTIKGKTILLDMGANNECSDISLFQFALMGQCLSKALLNIENPSIAILNVGEERMKGRELEQKSYDLLQNSGLNFIGYIEGHQIVNGQSDVVVTDGFSGNLVIKSSEGAISLLIKLIKQACNDSGVLAKIAGLLLKKSLKEKLKSIDPDVHNGAMFIGIDGIVIKSHGSASSTGISNAINVAYELSKREINNEIIKEMKKLEEQGIGFNLVEKIKQTLGIGI